MVLRGRSSDGLRQKRNQFIHGPDVIGNTGLHCWRNPQGLMDAAEVVMHKVESYGVCVILHFFAESVGKPGEAAHRHTHGEVLPLNVGSAHMGRVRVTNDGLHVGADALRRGIAALLIL